MKNLHIEYGHQLRGKGSELMNCGRSNGRREETRTDGSPSTLVEIEEPVDEDKLIEERRKKREALKAKLRGQGTPALATALGLNASSHDESTVSTTPGNDSLVSTPGENKSPGERTYSCCLCKC